MAFLSLPSSEERWEREFMKCIETVYGNVNREDYEFPFASSMAEYPLQRFVLQPSILRIPYCALPFHPPANINNNNNSSSNKQQTAFLHVTLPQKWISTTSKKLYMLCYHQNKSFYFAIILDWIFTEMTDGRFVGQIATSSNTSHQVFTQNKRTYGLDYLEIYKELYYEVEFVAIEKHVDFVFHAFYHSPTLPKTPEMAYLTCTNKMASIILSNLLHRYTTTVYSSFSTFSSSSSSSSSFRSSASTNNTCIVDPSIHFRPIAATYRVCLHDSNKEVGDTLMIIRPSLFSPITEPFITVEQWMATRSRNDITVLVRRIEQYLKTLEQHPLIRFTWTEIDWSVQYKHMYCTAQVDVSADQVEVWFDCIASGVWKFLVPRTDFPQYGDDGLNWSIDDYCFDGGITITNTLTAASAPKPTFTKNDETMPYQHTRDNRSGVGGRVPCIDKNLQQSMQMVRWLETQVTNRGDPPVSTSRLSIFSLPFSSIEKSGKRDLCFSTLSDQALVYADPDVFRQTSQQPSSKRVMMTSDDRPVKMKDFLNPIRQRHIQSKRSKRSYALDGALREQAENKATSSTAFTTTAATSTLFTTPSAFAKAIQTVGETTVVEHPWQNIPDPSFLSNNNNTGNNNHDSYYHSSNAWSVNEMMDEDYSTSANEESDPSSFMDYETPPYNPYMYDDEKGEKEEQEEMLIDEDDDIFLAQRTSNMMEDEIHPWRVNNSFHDFPEL